MRPEGLATLAIEQEVAVAAPPARVFEALTRDFAAWWGAPYLLDPQAATDVILEPTPGGRVLERWRDLLATRLKAFVETGARHGLRKAGGGA